MGFYCKQTDYVFQGFHFKTCGFAGGLLCLVSKIRCRQFYPDAGRRFAFFDLKPGFTTEGFRAYRDSLDNKKFEALVGCVQSLNEKITADESLGEGFCIGHSYFCNMELDEVTDEKLQSIVEYELIPMLKEYWFDEPLKVKEWSDNLRSAVK